MNSGLVVVVIAVVPVVLVGTVLMCTAVVQLGPLLQALPGQALAGHFHDTRGMGTALAWAALEAGIRRFDASVGGIGGCPFAPGAAGNLATEDLVLMAEACGFDTGISLAGLMHAVGHAQAVLGRELGGRSSAWLRR